MAYMMFDTNKDDLELRFWPKVDKCGPDQCWLWNGSRNKDGYGQVAIRKNGKPFAAKATHAALFLNGSPRPSLRHVAMHSCDNPQCVNPAHLQWGTVQENCQDRNVKNRQSSRKGQMNGRAKLADAAILAIRQDTRTCALVASEYGVSMSTISDIRLGKKWAHVIAAKNSTIADACDCSPR